MEKLFNIFRYFRHFLFSGFYHLGWPVVFRRNIVINGHEFISLGKNVVLDYDCVLNVITRHQNYKYNYQKPVIKIEDNVGITKGAFISAVRSIHIKKNVMIGPYCFIGDYNHGYEDITRPISKQPLKNIKPVVIEEGAWIGAHVSIASGVTIGKNSVIGANSVVTKDIPDYCVAVGTPAKIIKRYNKRNNNWREINKKG
ncbi:MAG: acyltransferase [Candidatus Levybacteria bacterium]|nr:acyltransferase [Candidatus Levybacteria bacterium]